MNSLTHIPGTKWEFDEDVTSIFDDMLRRSIPQYDVMRKSVVDIASAYAVESSTIVDLGCSRGEVLSMLIEKVGGYCKYIGIDVSDSMLDACQQRFFRFNKDLIQIEKLDLRYSYPSVSNVCVTISNLTLQFTPIEYRQKIVKRIYHSMLPGSVLILVEKILGETSEIDDLMVSLYYELKGNNGYSQESIERKKLSLEGVLVPVTAKWNEDLMHQAGFRYIDCFWRWMNFAGWIAVK